MEKNLWILLKFYFGIFTHMILIVIWGEWVWNYKVAHGGASGTPLNSVQPILWWIIVTEFIISTCIFIWQCKKTKGERNK